MLTPAVTWARLPITLAAFGQHRLAQVGDRLHIFDRFGGVADHEVQLDVVPAARIDGAGSFQKLLGADRLVDDLAHALGGGFGRQGEAAAAGILQRIHQLDGERLRCAGMAGRC